MDFTIFDRDRLMTNSISDILTEEDLINEQITLMANMWGPNDPRWEWIFSGKNRNEFWPDGKRPMSKPPGLRKF